MAVTLLTGSATAHAQFNPVSPSEPGAPIIYSNVVLLQNIREGGSVSGGGRYVVGNSVDVYAYTNSTYRFLHWTDTKGNVLSANSTYKFLNTASSDTLIAHYEFVPVNPSEPALPSTILYYRLATKGHEGCRTYGEGRYRAGTQVHVYTNMDSGYRFTGWTNSKGEIVSTSTSFNYTMPVDGDTLTATCVFDPNRPSEPGDPILSYNVSTVCSEGGWFSGSNGRYIEGTVLSFSAYVNAGYSFAGWYLNGELYTALPSFSYTLGKENANFYAKYVFNPGSPKEPLMPAISMYSYYLMTVNGVPGETVSYPIFLNNTEIVKDINIRLTFPEALSVNAENFVLSAKAQGYDVTVAEAVDTISMLEEGAKLYDFTLLGGETQPGTQALLTFHATIPDTVQPGKSWQVKINQVSMVMYDDTPVTAHTRNGRVGVYEWGDANTDGEVDVIDASLVSAHVLGDEVELDTHIADIHNDDQLDVIDFSDIVKKVLDSSEEVNE